VFIKVIRIKCAVDLIVIMPVFQSMCIRKVCPSPHAQPCTSLCWFQVTNCGCVY